MWKERVKELFDKYSDIYYFGKGDSEDLMNKEDFTKYVLLLAQEVHNKACEEQKIICWEKSKLSKTCHCQLEFIEKHERSCEMIEGDDKGSCEHWGQEDILYILKESITECPNVKFEL